MSSAAILTSIGVGICTIHGPMTGTIITSSEDVICDTAGSARVGDIVLGLCGHTGIITTGSDTVLVNDQKKACLGSTFVGIFNGTITAAVVDTIDVGG